MNLEQAIHEHWAASSALESLLSADRLTTGLANGGAPPYATLHVRTIRPDLPTNQGPAAETIALRIHVWHEHYEEGKAIVQQLREAFDGASLEVVEPARVARLRHVADSVKQHPDGLWQWSVDLAAMVCNK